MRHWLNKNMDRRFTGTLIGLAMSFSLGWYRSEFIPQVLDAITYLVIGLGGVNALQAAATALSSRRTGKRPPTKKETTP